MLKNTDKFEDSTHFSRTSNNRDLMIFVSVFMVGVLIILGFAKILSPNVDVAISVNDENAISAEDDETTSATSIIDERLRKLKIEDEGKKEGEEEMFSPELDERVILPKQRRKTVGEMEAEKNKAAENKVTEQKLNEAHDSVTQAAKESVKPAPKPQAPVATPSVNAKVVVGYYATEKQADVAKSIIQDAGLGVTPIVKNMGGYYTLQVGSYSTREKAQQFANSLLKSNFPARVVVE